MTNLFPSSSLMILSLLLGLFFILFFVAFTIQLIGLQQARKEVRERNEVVSSVIPFKVPKKRSGPFKNNIAMVAPFGIGKKMTVRSRILPMALSLVDKSYKVTLYIPLWDSPMRFDEKITLDNFEIVYIEPALRFAPAYDPFLALKLFNYLKKSDAEILYCFKPIGYSGLMVLVFEFLRRISSRKSTSFKNIITDTDDLEGKHGWADRKENNYLSKLIRDKQEKLVLKHSDVVTTVSKELRNFAISIRNNNPKGVFYIPNGIRNHKWLDSSFNMPDDLSTKVESIGRRSFIILYTRFSEYSPKRVVSIFSDVVEKIDDAALLIMGSPFDDVSRNTKEKLFYLLNKIDLEHNRVIYLPWGNYQDLPHYWSLSNVAMYLHDDTLINRTKSATKALDLMAAGKVVVADDMGELTHLLREDGEEFGILVPGYDDQLFAQKLIDILNNKSEQERLGKKAKERVRKDFNWSVLVETVEEAINFAPLLSNDVPEETFLTS